ncbi:hypothetical protein SAMN05444159_0084 [Bradyrhizobium lablabi]|uniref:Uncharacterized protein n=1 Tax=Bradyrhizobium lablabi TaxID=722472 RepID=A0A1M6HRW4_9BRAD|nr:hypothetical protein SAMN05444159_0084 [Bradyrhizobium lablabi]
MPGLDPGIHVLQAQSKKDVDGRDKPGHDVVRKCLNGLAAFPVDSEVTATAARRWSGGAASGPSGRGAP